MSLTWSAPINDGGIPIIDYKVSFKEESASSFTVYASDITTTAALVTGLSANTNYVFFIEARNSIGNSAPSEELTVPTIVFNSGVIVPPSAPKQLSVDVSVSNANQIGVFWLPPFNDGGEAVIDYSLFYD